MTKQRIFVTETAWERICGDGCCHDWGTTVDVSVEGEEILLTHTSHDTLDTDLLIETLEALGHEVVYEYNYEPDHNAPDYEEDE